ncbi:MAG: hypothetical protein HKN23_21220 [Verrucomicrobiales bacterium]|nr:hypothetical protein [Verrucomicrobiales bacterium]
MAGQPGWAQTWIWSGGDRKDESDVRFEKTLNLDRDPKSASLKITADFAAATIAVNDQIIGEIEAYDPPTEFEIRSILKSGENRIVIDAQGVPGPSAIAAEMMIETRDGDPLIMLTDESWGPSIATFGKIHPHRFAPNRLPEISPFAEYNQWKEATDGTQEQLSPLPPGFEIEKLRAAHEGEGSWVSLAIDSKGRVIIAREQRGLLRLTLPEQKIEVINDTLEECRGLVFRGADTLYANANRSRGLFRLRDTNGDDQFDDIRLLRRTEGSTGHGRNDIAIGPDGRVHAIHGDVVLIPGDAEKSTVAIRSAPKELGHQVSTNLDGNGWKIHNRGLRNPYGIDFNPHGEPFTYDADNEGDVGLPFYRPTRINHLVSGANYGWHQDQGNSRNLTIYAPDTVPTTYDVGRGSPTGVKFGTRSNFPPKYRDALFVLDWSYGRIIAVHLAPRGGSYYASGEVFLEGRPLNVTDLDFEKDGSMLLITGGRKTQSALYRIRFSGEAQEPEKPTAQASARAEFSETARERRRFLETWHGNADAPGFDEPWAALGDPDPWIRNAARVAIETQLVKRWRKSALAAKPGLRGLTALLALARATEEPMDDLSEIVSQLEKMPTDGWGRNEQLTAMRIYEIAASVDPLLVACVEPIQKQIEPWVNSTSDPVRREAVRILVAAESPKAVPIGLRLAAEAEDQFGRLHFLEMLSDASMKSGWTDENRTAYFRALAAAKRLSLGDRLMPGFFKTVETNALANVPDESQRTEFSKLLAEGEAEDELPDIETRPVVKAWVMSDFSDDDLNLDPDERDLERGRKMYDAALCSRCHVVGTHGRPVGPDLTTVARRFSRRDLLESIIEPSKVVGGVHRNVVIQKTDGTTVMGRIIQNDFRKSLLYVSQNPFRPTDLTEIPKSEIKSNEESSVSPMPPALLNTLTKEEILDLLFFLNSG